MLTFFKRKKKLKKPVGITEFFKSRHTENSTFREAFLREMEMKEAYRKAEARTFLRIFKAPNGNPRVAMDSKDETENGGCNNIHNAYRLQTYGITPAQLSWFASWGFIGYQMCALIAQHWLVDKACKMPADDAVRNSYEVGAQDKKVSDTILKKLKQKDKEYGLEAQLIEHVYFGRVFGVRVMKFEIATDNPEEFYANPFNIDAVKPNSYRGMVQIDPYWMIPELDAEAAANPESKHFYEPTWWNINGQRIHRTHLVIMRNGQVADVLKPTYFYGGIPLPQKIANRVYAAERTADEAPLLALTKRSTVLHTDLNKAVLDPKKFAQKMDAWTTFLSNYGVKVVGEKDVIEQMDTALTDMDALIMTQYQLVAAIANVPSVKLMGTSPKGFGASGEYEENNYHEELKSIQAHKMSPVIDRHHMLVIKSDFPKNEQFIATHTWNALDSTTSKGIAENNKLKGETDAILVNTGAINGNVVRARLNTDKNSGYSGLIESNMSEEDMYDSPEQAGEEIPRQGELFEDDEEEGG